MKVLFYRDARSLNKVRLVLWGAQRRPKGGARRGEERKPS